MLDWIAIVFLVKGDYAPSTNQHISPLPAIRRTVSKRLAAARMRVELGFGNS
jgi:hypothetical protein